MTTRGQVREREALQQYAAQYLASRLAANRKPSSGAPTGALIALIITKHPMAMPTGCLANQFSLSYHSNSNRRAYGHHHRAHTEPETGSDFSFLVDTQLPSGVRAPYGAVSSGQEPLSLTSGTRHPSGPTPPTDHSTTAAPVESAAAELSRSHHMTPVRLPEGTRQQLIVEFPDWVQTLQEENRIMRQQFARSRFSPTPPSPQPVTLPTAAHLSAAHPPARPTGDS